MNKPLITQEYVFDASCDRIVYLYDVLAGQRALFTGSEVLELHVTFAENTQITVVDNLCCGGCALNEALWKAHIYFYVHKNARVSYHLGALDGACPRSKSHAECSIERDLRFILREEGAFVEATCACLGGQHGNFVFNTLQEHQASQTESSLIIKGALTDTARMKSNSLIKVHKHCQHVVAQQVSKSLLLSAGARAITIPSIEIESDGVECRHDATIARLDREHLFYLQSRGYSLKLAQEQLIAAFLR